MSKEKGTKKSIPAKNKKRIVSIIIILIIMAPTVYVLKAIFSVPAVGTDYVRVGKLNVHFANTIEDCMKVPIDEKAAPGLLQANEAILLFDPLGSERLAVAVYETARITNLVKIPTSVAYTEKYEKKNETAVMAINMGRPHAPVVLVQVADATYVKELFPGQVVVSGKDDMELQWAACRLGLALLDTKFGLKLEK